MPHWENWPFWWTLICSLQRAVWCTCGKKKFGIETLSSFRRDCGLICCSARQVICELDSAHFHELCVWITLTLRLTNLNKALRQIGSLEYVQSSYALFFRRLKLNTIDKECWKINKLLYSLILTSTCLQWPSCFKWHLLQTSDLRMYIVSKYSGNSLIVMCFISKMKFTLHFEMIRSPGGVLPYMGYIGMCRGKGYDFRGARSLNRVSFLTLLILCSWCGPLIG